MTFDPEAEPVVELPTPTYGDVRDLLLRLPHQPYDESTFRASYVFSDIFVVKHRLLRELDEKQSVKIVVETGGYFGAFLVTAVAACPNLQWLYWTDNESYTEGSNAMCGKNLRWAMDEGRHRFSWARVETLLPLVGGLRPDLVHVDGDHSFGGCFLDLVLAWAMKPREIWVDDYTAIEDVKRAVDVFADTLGLRVDVHITANGLAVIRP